MKSNLRTFVFLSAASTFHSRKKQLIVGYVKSVGGLLWDLKSP